jgi:DNA-binding transcriptional LysR family regulator
MVSRHVQDLEERLGTRLLNRTTRRISLTEPGAAYYERCQQLLRDVEEMDLSVAREVQQPRGVLHVNAPVVFGTRHLAPLLAEYTGRHPEGRHRPQSHRSLRRSGREGADLAVRIGVLTESTLVARRLCPVRICCALRLAISSAMARRARPRTSPLTTASDTPTLAAAPSGR